MGHQNNQITIKDILSKHDNVYDVLLAMQLNLFPLSSLDLVDIDNEKQYGSYYAFSIPILIMKNNMAVTMLLVSQFLQSKT